MTSSTDLDFGGLDGIYRSIKVGATQPGQAGTEISSTELGYLDSVTAGTVTASKTVVVDSSKDIGNFRNITLDAGGQITTSVSNTVFPVFLNQTQQALSGAGAVTLTEYYTAVTSTGANALTLADSTITGQVKKVQMIVDAGDATLTFNTDATIVFADVGDTAELIWNGSDWIPIALYNIVDGATAPAYTPAS